MQRAPAQLTVDRVRSTPDPAAVLMGLHQRVAAYFAVSDHEVASQSLRRPVLAARAVFCDLAVSHSALSLSTIARCLAISRPSVARGVARAHDT